MVPRKHVLDRACFLYRRDKKDIEKIKQEIDTKINNVQSIKELNELKIEYTSKTGLITTLQQGIKEASDKKAYGMMVNEIKNHFTNQYDIKLKELEEIE